MQQLDTDVESHLFTYTSFVTTVGDIETLLGGAPGENRPEEYIIQSNEGVIQKMLLNTLLDHSIPSEDRFFVYLNG